ncbi:MAG: class I SAM-dependent methyltransferase [Candidatus Saccharibacteria bacterium]|nr:class I SAM-dependent methyltransferase [Microbacteriaceae bacterium]
MSEIERIRREIDDLLVPVPIDFGGGCSASKATVLAYLIKSQNMKRSIDIGVYRGRSFFPQAYVHTRYTHGHVFGVDPYSSDEAMEHDHKELQDEINHFASHTDFEALHADVDAMRTRMEVVTGSTLLRKTANAAAVDFAASGEKFGLIHIDGNHDTESVLGDVANYLPLLDPDNGFLVLDDISWTSVKPAVDRVSGMMALLYARVDSHNDYAVFWNGKSTTKKSRLRKNLALAAEN